ncbi:MAG: thiamine diphosphokinase [Brevirhabdus sp.]
MLSQIVHGAAKLTLLGGGKAPKAVVNAALFHAPVLVAADGGADRALALGHRPEAVIGDLDSLSASAHAALPADRILRIAEQDSTDFDKCLCVLPAPLVLAVGMTGRRLDHTLAAFNTLVRHAHRQIIVLGAHDVCFACPPRLRLDLEPGSRASLFPMARVTGRSTGLHWPIDGLEFAPDGQSGTSNRADGPVSLDFDAPGMVALLPFNALGAVMAGLAQSAPWPAPERPRKAPTG